MSTIAVGPSWIISILPKSLNHRSKALVAGALAAVILVGCNPITQDRMTDTLQKATNGYHCAGDISRMPTVMSTPIGEGRSCQSPLRDCV